MVTTDDLARVIGQLRFARWYTCELLSDIPESRWFEMPGGAATHVAWQVGHLAFAQFAMCILRQRGEQLADDELFSPALRKLFGRDSAPSADVNLYPAAKEIRAVFDRVNEQVLDELAGCDPAALDEASLRPHRFVKTRLEALVWSGQHELVHAGQIALLRRLLGLAPQW